MGGGRKTRNGKRINKSKEHLNSESEGEIDPTNGQLIDDKKADENGRRSTSNSPNLKNSEFECEEDETPRKQKVSRRLKMDERSSLNNNAQPSDLEKDENDEGSETEKIVEVSNQPRSGFGMLNMAINPEGKRKVSTQADEEGDGITIQVQNDEELAPTKHGKRRSKQKHYETSSESDSNDEFDSTSESDGDESTSQSSSSESESDSDVYTYRRGKKKQKYRSRSSTPERKERKKGSAYADELMSLKAV